MRCDGAQINEGLERGNRVRRKRGEAVAVDAAEESEIKTREEDRAVIVGSIDVRKMLLEKMLEGRDVILLELRPVHTQCDEQSLCKVALQNKKILKIAERGESFWVQRCEGVGVERFGNSKLKGWGPLAQ